MTENVSGVIYNDPITSLDGFSVEFTIDKDADAVIEGGTGDVYLSFGLSCKNAKPMQITVTKINGESLAYVESEDESESESSTAAPQTGDDSLLHFMLLMILPAALFTIAGARFIRKACR